MARFIRPAAKWVLSVLLGAALLELLHQFGLYPERKLAELITTRPGEAQVRLIFWSLAALISAAALFAEKWWPLTGALWHRKKVQPPPTGPMEPEDSSVWMTGVELVTHIVDQSGWALGMGMDREVLLNHPGGYLVREIQRVAQNGDLAAIGRKNGKGLHEKIPDTFWFSSTIDVRSLFGSDAAKMGRTRPAGSERMAEIIVDDVPYYSDLRFKRADVYKAWGRPGTSPRPPVSPVT